jgi:hypothetical protein
MTKTTDVYHEIGELIDEDRTGLMAGFIYQAIGEFANGVINEDPERLTQATNGFVNGQAWVDCAKQILAKQDDIPF